jgi:hypothetical protein
MNKCDWCGAETTNKECYTAMSPLIEKYEVLIREWDKIYGQFWYDNVDGKIDEKILKDVLTYEQATSTVGRGIICNSCHEKDEIVYQKYRQLTTKEGDPYGMLKIVVDDNDNVDYDIDKMEMWYDDVKNSLDK